MSEAQTTAPVQDAGPDYFGWGRMCEERFKTDQGLEHGFIDKLANSVEDHGFKHMSEPNRKHMIAEKARCLKPVKFQYLHMRNQENGKWEGYYGADWPGEPLRGYRLLHGHEYVLPQGLKDKVDEMGSPKRSGLIDTNGQELMQDGKKEKTHMLVRVD